MEEQNCKTSTRYKKARGQCKHLEHKRRQFTWDYCKHSAFEFVAMTQTVLAALYRYTRASKDMGDIVETERVTLAGSPWFKTQTEPLGEFCAAGEGIVQGREPDCWHSSQSKCGSSKRRSEQWRGSCKGCAARGWKH